MRKPPTQGGPVVLRASRFMHICGWCLAVFGVLFSLSGLAALGDDSPGGGIGGLATMALAGVVFALLGACMALSRVELRDDHLACYSFFRPRRIGRGTIASVEIGASAGGNGWMEWQTLVLGLASPTDGRSRLARRRTRFRLQPLSRSHIGRSTEILAEQRELIRAWLT